MNKEAMKMKKRIITLAITATLIVSNISAYAAEIPRESTPLSTTEQQIQITENLISDILDEVQSGKLGYTLAAGYANTRIRKAVIAGETSGHGYGILSPIAQNAIRNMHDIPAVDMAMFTAARKLLLAAK